MSIHDLMVLRGRVGTEVTLRHPEQRHPEQPEARVFAWFRMAVPRHRRKDNGEWEESEALWYTVKAWGALAQNIRLSLRRGDPVIVVGRPVAQSWDTTKGERRTEIAVTAQSAGLDLMYCVASMHKLRKDPERKEETQTGALSTQILSTREADPAGNEFSTPEDPDEAQLAPEGEEVDSRFMAGVAV